MNGMDGLRRAALTLHGLLPADREWVLSELDTSDRAALTQLLAELAELGIPADRELVQEALAGRQPPARGPRPTLVRLRGATGDQIHTLMVHEPDALVAQLLLVEDWPWKSELLAMFGEARQGSVIAMMRRIEAPPAMRRVLIEQLGERVRSDNQLAEAAVGAAGVVVQRKPSVGSLFSKRLSPWRR